MKTKEVFNVINGLPTRYPSEKTEQKALVAITETSEAIAPILEQKGLRIAKGGSKQSVKNGFTRIYLETLDNTSHDYRTRNYKDTVIRVWEWQTKTSGYFNPLTSKSIIRFCNELKQLVEHFQPNN